MKNPSGILLTGETDERLNGRIEKLAEINAENMLDQSKIGIPGELSIQTRNQLLKTLGTRFHEHKERHPGLKWDPIATRLENKPQALCIAYQMEEDEGEPDIWSWDGKTDTYEIFDSSPEVPSGRTDLVFDREAESFYYQGTNIWLPPRGNVLDIATWKRLGLLTVSDHKLMNRRGDYDRDSLCWMASPLEMVVEGRAYGYGKYGTMVLSTKSHTANSGFRGKLIF